MVGQVLGDRYEIERELGQQSGRWTLLAKDVHAGERVVIKLLCTDENMRPDDLKLFEREAEILKSLSHPSIPNYLGYFQQNLPTGQALALVQTYVKGRSLEECFKVKRTFTEAEAKQIAKSILYILIYLQSRNPSIVHRDIKPNSIILAEKKTHLVDFGSVKTLFNKHDGSGTAFTLVGTHDYTPPEQWSGRALTASDLYSLGLTIIAIVTGKHPSQLPRKGNRFEFEQLIDLSPAFADWLKWMTETSLEKRLGTAMQALQALDAAQVRRF
ncbi:serine/threonine protein kinase [Myxacorys almedinensis]|uniref:Protein kinase n=1 Tax=Myxacorys almedinensis A TaxID=2690445 RepID=A0A8J7Z3M6_9CYAN|nr:serine/threonine-protein kinase [Myxacorys almedinensis]NDJ15883.1 protein kinase [Myxacorys almedinensis A]